MLNNPPQDISAKSTTAWREFSGCRPDLARFNLFGADLSNPRHQVTRCRVALEMHLASSPATRKSRNASGPEIVLLCVHKRREHEQKWSHMKSSGGLIRRVVGIGAH